MLVMTFAPSQCAVRRHKASYLRRYEASYHETDEGQIGRRKIIERSKVDLSKVQRCRCTVPIHHHVDLPVDSF